MTKNNRFFYRFLLGLVLISLTLVQCKKGDSSSEPVPGTPAEGTLVVSSQDGVFAFDGATGKIKWEYKKTGGFPERIGGTITPTTYYIVNESQRLMAFDLKDGKVKWTSSNFQLGQCYPVIVNGVVYYADLKNAYALDANTGARKWAYKLTTPSVSLYCLTVADNQVFLGSDFQKSSIIALDAATGEKKAEYEGTTGISSPKVANGLLYIGTFRFIRAYDIKTGKIKWENPLRASTEDGLAVENNVLYLSVREGFSNFLMGAYDATTGVEKWKKSAPSGFDVSAFSVNKGIVAVTTRASGLAEGSGSVIALSAITGQTIWEQPFQSVKPYNRALAVPGVIFMTTFAEYKAALSAYDAKTGKLIWSNPDFKDQGWISFVDNSGNIYNTPISGQPNKP